MADITWIKLRTNMFDDEKIKLIERLPEGDGILVVWIKLLAHAGKSNCNGYIMISENIPMNIDEVAAIFNRPFEKVKYAISVLQRYKMIDVTEEDVISITNWDKHQNIEGMDKIRAQNRERKRLERERKKTLLLDNSFDESCHVTVTGSHATDIEEDIDKEKDNNIKHTQQVADDFQNLMSLYDSINELPKYRKISPKRKAQINARIKEYGLEAVKDVLIKCKNSNYLLSNKDNWFDMDWIFNPNNFLKILEDKYKNKENKVDNQLKPWEVNLIEHYSNGPDNGDDRNVLPITIK